MFVISQAAKGVVDITIRNYRYHMKNMSNYFDAEKPFDEVTNRDIEAMVVAMRKAGLAHNTIATYNRMLKTFYNWCNAEELSSMAKTQYSFTDDQTKLGAPRDFTITVRNVKVSAGAGFLVALTGEIMTMPGLPKVPAAERIDVDETGKISGLF